MFFRHYSFLHLTRTEVAEAVVEADGEGEDADDDGGIAGPAATIEHLHHREIRDETNQYNQCF